MLRVVIQVNHVKHLDSVQEQQTVLYRIDPGNLEVSHNLRDLDGLWAALIQQTGLVKDIVGLQDALTLLLELWLVGQGSRRTPSFSFKLPQELNLRRPLDMPLEVFR